MARVLLVVVGLLLASGAAGQPQSTASTPAQTPQGLANQVKQVTDYMLEVQYWKKNAASGKSAGARKTQAREAAAAYLKQRALLLELLARLQLWADFADDIDHEKPALTDADVNAQRQKDFEAIRSIREELHRDDLRRDELHDEVRAGAVSASKKP